MNEVTYTIHINGKEFIIKESTTLTQLIEKLEQLRWLQNGYDISVFEVEFNGMEINTPEELKEWHRRNSQ